MITTAHAADVHATPNAVMRRYPATTVAVWRTEMAPGASGPLHTIDKEQVVTVLEGTLEASVDGVTQPAAAGDAVTIPPGAPRRLANGGESTLVTLTAARPGAVARVGAGEPVEVPWAGMGTMSTDVTTIARTLMDTMQQAWNDADGTGFAAAFTPGADFVDIRGDDHEGREAIARGHQAIFETIYRGSSLAYSLMRARVLTPEVILAHGRGTLVVPSGPLAGTNHSTMSLVVVNTPEGWLVDAFQNTLVPPT